MRWGVGRPVSRQHFSERESPSNVFTPLLQVTSQEGAAPLLFVTLPIKRGKKARTKQSFYCCSSTLAFDTRATVGHTGVTFNPKSELVGTLYAHEALFLWLVRLKPVTSYITLILLNVHPETVLWWLPTKFRTNVFLQLLQLFKYMRNRHFAERLNSEVTFSIFFFFWRFALEWL